MPNDITPCKPPDDDDGFHRSSTSGRSGDAILKWTDTLSWLDRDGLTPPAPVLVWKLDDFLRSWKDNRPTDITDKPLPDPEELNAAIPQGEWENGVDGKPRPPWQHYVGVYSINPATGKGYRYEHCTVGAHMAWDELRDAVINMRLLRGDRCLPLVLLSEKPWKVPTGLRKRPYFDIVGWKTPGGDREAISAKPPTPQLTGPNIAPVETPAPVTPTTLSPTPTTPVSNSAQPQQAKPKPPVNLAAETLDAMGDVKPVTTAEIMDDDVPW
jgi:hypothetical protein